MRKFRKKPVIVEAEQWNGESLEEIRRMTGCNGLQLSFNKVRLIVPSLEGSVSCNLGDWIMKGVKGEFYCCNDEIFKMTYDEVTDDTII